MSEYHTPVLFEESLEYLVTNPDGNYADATFGGGGHSRGIISRLSDKGTLMSFDRDADALENAIDDPRFTLVHNNFRFIHNYALLHGVQFDGILADLGVSSHQFDTAERGFSFRYDAPLDMRMNTQSEFSAQTVVNTYEERELEKVFRIYGEVENSRNVARLIVAARSKAPITTTGELDEAIKSATPAFADHKYLAKVYQALRIEVNQEMKSLQKFLEGAVKSLKPGGRLVVITYHSLEDRMVKNFIKTGNIEGEIKKDVFGRSDEPLEQVTRKPVLPTEEEISSNTRARSAKLRVAALKTKKK